jgi:hypothetical protein
LVLACGNSIPETQVLHDSIIGEIAFNGIGPRVALQPLLHHHFASKAGLDELKDGRGYRASAQAADLGILPEQSVRAVPDSGPDRRAEDCSSVRGAP